MECIVLEGTADLGLIHTQTMHSPVPSPWLTTLGDPSRLSLPSLSVTVWAAATHQLEFAGKFNLLAIPNLQQSSHFTEEATEPGNRK